MGLEKIDEGEPDEIKDTQEDYEGGICIKAVICLEHLALILKD